MLKIFARSVDHLDELLRHDLSKLPGVHRLSTVVCLKTIKRQGRIAEWARMTEQQQCCRPPDRRRYSAGIANSPGKVRVNAAPTAGWLADRKSVVQGMSGTVRVDLGGRRIIKKKTRINNE